jgi:hypothetical protein
MGGCKAAKTNADAAAPCHALDSLDLCTSGAASVAERCRIITDS